MVTSAEIKIWGTTAGYLSLDPGKGDVYFEYEPAFGRTGYELSPIMQPFERGRVYYYPEFNDNEAFKGLPGFIADALPDKWGTMLVNRWLAENGRDKDTYNVIERLLYQGSRSMGALEFCPASRKDLEKSIKIEEVDGLVRAAREVLNAREDLHASLDNTEDAISAILSVGTSAGGSRAKAVVAYNKDTQEIVSGQIDAPDGFEHYLLKLDGVTNQVLGDPQYFGCIEYAYYRMAVECGIDMTECFLLPDGRRKHFMTKRFDRIGGNHKVHMVSLCGMAHLDFNRPGAYSYEELFGVMRHLGLPKRDAEQIFRRMVFNVIGRNQDDHTKNFCFLMDRDGRWKLSPAFDMSYAYNANGGYTAHHQMTINGKNDGFTVSDLLSVAESIHLKNAETLIADTQTVFSNIEDFMDKDVPHGIVDGIKANLQLEL